MKNKKAKTVPYEEFLQESLSNSKLAIAYLNESFSYEGPHKEKYFLKSLRQVVEAHGMTEISRRSSVSRRTLYKALSDQGNPRWETIMAILGAIGCGFKIV